MAIETKKIIVKNAPSDALTLDYSSPEANFEVVSTTLPELKDGEVLIKTLYLSNDPTQRNWIQKDANAEGSYLPPVLPGDTVRSLGLGEIIESKNENYSKGDVINGFVGWAQYNVLPPSAVFNKIPKSNLPLPVSLGPAGMTGLTAYFGLELANLKPTDTAVISAASGATGSMAVQIAKKVAGCARVVGIAGGKEKCEFVKSLGADACVDYRDSANFKQNLKEAIGVANADDGADVYFDNVGGEMLDTMLALTKRHGTIIACGAVAAYNDRSKGALKNFFLTISRRLTVKGFIVTDFAAKYEQAVATILKSAQEGKIDISERAYKVVDLSNDFEQVPFTWATLFDSTKKLPGKLVTKLADPE